MGGAHAVAALAYGTEEVGRVDVICGPGNLYSQEAKRQVSGSVGIDGFYGPSDVLVIADGTADPRLIALDLLAQGEHGPETVVAATSDDPALLDAVAAQVAELAADRPTSDPAGIALADAPSMNAALAFAEAFAPEHLELVGPDRRAPGAPCARRRRDLRGPRRARPPSATTSPARTTACRRTARRASRRASRRGCSAAA